MRKTALGLGFFLLSLSLSSKAEPFNAAKQLELVQQEAWHYYMSYVMAFQPSKVGAKKFVLTFLPPSKNSEVTKLKIALLQNKDWPKVTIENDALVVSHRGKKTTLQLVDIQAREFLLNGKMLKIETGKTLLSQVETALEDGQIGFWQRISPTPEAHAGVTDTSPIALVHAAAIGGALATSSTAKTFFVYGFANLVSGGQIAGAAIAAGGAAVIAAKAVAIASLACGVYAVGDTLIRQDRSVGGNFLNCAAAPLSLINKNPRDRLYLADIQCANEKNELNVRLISPSRRKETRTFSYSGERLRSVEMKEGEKKARLFTSADGAKFEKGELDGGLQLYRPRSRKELDSVDGLLSNFEYYRGLCVGENSQARRERVLRLIKDNTYGERAYDEQSADDLNRSAQ